jgi:hypothetical protein
MQELEKVRWGHFLLRVQQGPLGAIWSIEDLASGESSAFQSPYELLTFIRTHLVEKEEDILTAGEAETL